MICDTVGALKSFFTQSCAWQQALEFIAGLTPEIESGKYVIDGDNVFAVVSRYDTRPEDGAEMETHKKYADIQLLLAGEEFIAWQPKDDNLPLTVEYCSEKDIAFYAAGDCTMCKLRPGLAAVFMPTEYHMPQLMVGSKTEPVTKVVVKIDASLL